MSHLNFWHFSYFHTNFCPNTTDLSGNTVWLQAPVFNKLAKLTFFGFFNELLSTQNVYVASFARNIAWDFFCDFQTFEIFYKRWIADWTQKTINLGSNSVTKPRFRTLGMLKSEEPAASAGPSFSWLHVRSNTVRISWPRVTGQAPHSGRFHWLCYSRLKARKWLIPLTTFHSPADHLESPLIIIHFYMNKKGRKESIFHFSCKRIDTDFSIVLRSGTKLESEVGKESRKVALGTL